MSEKNQRAPWEPNDYLAYGLVGALVGGVVFGLTYENDASMIGLIILGIAGLIFQIGVIAKGVQVGNRASFNDEA